MVGAPRLDEMPVNHDVRRQLGRCGSDDGAMCSQCNRNAHAAIIVAECSMEAHPRQALPWCRETA